jgi:hypothetical protein
VKFELVAPARPRGGLFVRNIIVGMPYLHGPVVPDYSGLGALNIAFILAVVALGALVAFIALSKINKRPGPPKLHK